jgi:hypothetical protein
MNKSGKILKRVKLDMHVVRCIQKVASQKKMTFEDAVVFLINRVITPNKRAS